MSELDLRDVSTLASLQPAAAKEMHYQDYKNRLRLQGSQYMSLKRPSRLAEASRDYVAGDPVNLIDWKAYARTDQLIVREVRDESSSNVLIGVDLSPTMFWPTLDVPGPKIATKAEIAMRLALHLAYAHLRMGDQVEIRWLLSESATMPTHFVRPRRPAAIKTGFVQLAARGFRADEWFTEGGTTNSLPTRVDLAFWLGDALGAADIAGFLSNGPKSFFIHTLSSMELETDWLDDGISYFDQGQQLKEYQGQVLKQRNQYLQQLAAWRQGLQQAQHLRGGEYLTVSDRTQISAYQSALQAYIKAAGKA